MYIDVTQQGRAYFNHITENGTGMGGYDHILSICCPDDSSMKKISDNHHIYRMWDIDKVLENNFRKYLPPTTYQCLYPVNTLAEKITNNLDKRHKVLVHCDAGVSRSSAMTLGLLWKISETFFSTNKDLDSKIIKEIIDLRKEFCASLMSDDNNFLKWYIQGKNLMRGVRPNQAMLREYREHLDWFPW